MYIESLDTESATLDELRGFGLWIKQPKIGPRINLDTILLSGFTKVKHKDRVCDLGCAHGGVSLILAKRRLCRVVGVDIQGPLVEMAFENAVLNGLSSRVSFVEGDIRLVRDLFPTQSFDVVVSNPPYGDPLRRRSGKNDSRNKSRSGETCSVSHLAKACRYLLGDGGRAYFIFSSERMPEFLASMRSEGVEPKALMPVYPRASKDSAVFTLKAIRGGSPGMRLLPPLFVSEKDLDHKRALLDYYGQEGSPCP